MAAHKSRRKGQKIPFCSRRLQHLARVYIQFFKKDRKFVDEGKAYLRIGVGCTGGRHRSVAISEELAKQLEESGVNATVRHRDADI